MDRDWGRRTLASAMLWVEHSCPTEVTSKPSRTRVSDPHFLSGMVELEVRADELKPIRLS